MSDPIRVFAEHVSHTCFEDLPEAAICAARIFILDTIGVGLAGTNGPRVRELIESSAAMMGEGAARCWGHRRTLSAPGAAMINGYQIHNSEFDCVHEAAVVHPVTVCLSAVMAHADRTGGVRGRDLVTAVVLGVDVACHLGVATTTGLRFFRPATAGIFAAAAGLGRVLRFDADRQQALFGHVYGQLCGTMQPHSEGSMLLGLQIGFNARNAVIAADLARRGIPSIANILEGPFGYFGMIEAKGDLGRVLDDIGKVWRITEVAHKPFPSGRATHGMLDGFMGLQADHGFDATEIESAEARIPPLTHHLVGRPVIDDMTVNYARLCGSYVSACALLRGSLGIDDFSDARRRDPETLALGRRITAVVDGNPDPNALTPITVVVRLKEGRVLRRTIDIVYGNPAKPMTRESHLAKFRRNFEAALNPLPAANADRLIEMMDNIEHLDDVREISALLCPTT
ncbi:MAG: MmgE/PrpD family protein [Hyphomicrobiaceae bacterium]